MQDDFDAERETNLAAVIASLQIWDVKDMVSKYYFNGTFSTPYLYFLIFALIIPIMAVYH